MKTKNIICFILATVIGIFSLAGCTESTQKYNIFSENSESNFQMMFYFKEYACYNHYLLISIFKTEVCKIL